MKPLLLFIVFFTISVISINAQEAYTPICTPAGPMMVPKHPSPGAGTSGAGNCIAYALYIAQGGIYDPSKTGSAGFALGNMHGGIMSSPLMNGGLCEKTEGDTEMMLRLFFESSNDGAGSIGVVRSALTNPSLPGEPIHAFYNSGAGYNQVRGIGFALQTGISYSQAIADYLGTNGLLSPLYEVVWYKKKSGVNFADMSGWNKNIIGCDKTLVFPTTSVIPTPSITGPSQICFGSTATYNTNSPNCVFYQWSVSSNLNIPGSNNSNSVNVTSSNTGVNGAVQLMYKKEWFSQLLSATPLNVITPVTPTFSLGVSTVTPCPNTSMTVTLFPVNSASNIVWTVYTAQTGTVLVSGQGTQIATIKPGPNAYAVMVTFTPNGCSSGPQILSSSFTTALCR